jgi:hypothetical protein
VGAERDLTIGIKELSILMRQEAQLTLEHLACSSLGKVSVVVVV